MRKLKVFSVLVACSLVLILGLASCDMEDDSNQGGGNLIGSWVGNIGGYYSTVIISGAGWTIMVPSIGYTDTGTYSLDSPTSGRLYSNESGGIQVGTQGQRTI